MPPCTLPSRCKHAPAKSPACPMRPTKHLKQLPTNCVPQHHQQHAKLHSPLRPTVKMQKCADQNTTCTSSPNCMPPSTLPSILKRCARTAICTSNSTPLSTPISTYTSTPNRTPPSTRPSISQITFPSLLEVRTPTAFSYLGKKGKKKERTKTGLHHQKKNISPPPPKKKKTVAPPKKGTGRKGAARAVPRRLLLPVLCAAGHQGGGDGAAAAPGDQAAVPGDGFLVFLLGRSVGRFGVVWGGEWRVWGGCLRWLVVVGGGWWWFLWAFLKKKPPRLF